MNVFRNASSRADSPDVTLIVTCYNKPELLKIVLQTAILQTTPPKEIIVADDGSKEENFTATREIRAQTSIPIIHAWQPDEGFRLNRSRNNALSLATGEYVVLLDGDCFVGPHFIEDHRAAARKGRFVAGTRVQIWTRLKERILATGDARVGLFTRGVSKRQYAVRSRLLSKLASTQDKPGAWVTSKNAAGANVGFWLEDAVRANGFNEVFVGYGGDDVEFFTRLSRLGVARFKMRYLGAAYHFRHDDRARIPRENFQAQLDASLEDDRIRVKDEFGLTRALREGVPRVER